MGGGGLGTYSPKSYRVAGNVAIFIAWCQTVNVMINIQINTGLIQSTWSTFLLLGYYKMVEGNVGKHIS